MHSLKVCAATAAALIAIAAVDPAPAQFFDTPPPAKKTKKAKAPPKAPVAPAAPAAPAPDAAQPDAAPPQATAPAETPPAAAPAAFTGVGTHPAKRPPPPPPHEGCKNTGNFA